MRRYLKVKFESISDAEDAFNINYFDDCPVTQQFPSTTTSTPTPQSAEVPHFAESPMLTLSPLRDSDDRKLPGSILDVVSSGFMELTKRQRQQLMVYLFKKWLLADFHSTMSSSFVPSDFLPLLSSALKVLFVNGKNNVLYDAARCFGDTCPGGTPRMPLHRMPFGLIAHNLHFFASDNVANLEAPEDYKSWYQSMYTLFGNKWAAMHNGPMWSYVNSDVDTPQDSESLNVDTSGPTDIVTEALQQTFGGDSSTCMLTEECSSVELSPTTGLPNNPADIVSPSDVSEGIQNLSMASEEPLSLVASRNPVSYLWTSLSQADISEHQESSLTLSELEAIHGIHPRNVSGTSNRDRNPLNVRILFLWS